ncbi:MAG TPA: hypothetical protein VLE73_02305 [Candidatus Saccharimonadales bacterium]|nr:hypothetical protein [Candidatus Saccharimonadales bacterium]
MIQRELTGNAAPVHGAIFPGLAIASDGYRRTLMARTRHGAVVDARARVGSYIDYPGIKVYQLYEAEAADAEAAGLYGQRILLSMAGNGLAVVTSRLGYRVGGQVTIPRDNLVESAQYDMHDYSANVGNISLTAVHNGRLMKAGGDPFQELQQHDADAAFRALAESVTTY